mmetsp:Transcript_13444/g.36207  ORF Transcript_13444/g.36207 Transcript_13444/m.36207 type:complete len:80 (+) Transcript_13444:223-462(+)|eukprot:CAMPEP_0117524498 /NCGR_PEP_ID=MMETSP0784-20121206/35277_1 /TAXON_ID=39447 /ORGANISM="" /LENGTH=79 /DNA_ID=CAMNT_0005320649 /DNA_START=151 /DNA_END=390 /DNA_ORIENTATION=-
MEVTTFFVLLRIILLRWAERGEGGRPPKKSAAEVAKRRRIINQRLGYKVPCKAGCSDSAAGVGKGPCVDLKNQAWHKAL